MKTMFERVRKGEETVRDALGAAEHRRFLALLDRANAALEA
jgi:hypothetical protein